MIQEILDYLLIRSLLYNSDSKELIDAVVEKENFIYVLNNIYNLMQEEDFLLTSPDLIKNVADFIHKYRFDYNKEKEINDKMNYIIERLNTYHSMSVERKEYLIDNWISEESNNRSLPRCYQNLPNLLGMITMDTYYFKSMITLDEPFNIGYVAEYVSIINIIMNKYPECFTEDLQFLEATKQILATLKNYKELSKVDSKMVKKAFSRIEKQYPQSQSENYQKVIKKTQN